MPGKLTTELFPSNCSCTVSCLYSCCLAVDLRVAVFFIQLKAVCLHDHLTTIHQLCWSLSPRSYGTRIVGFTQCCGVLFHTISACTECWGPGGSTNYVLLGRVCPLTCYLLPLMLCNRPETPPLLEPTAVIGLLLTALHFRFP